MLWVNILFLFNIVIFNIALNKHHSQRLSKSCNKNGVMNHYRMVQGYVTDYRLYSYFGGK